jgi:molybdate transport system substrate-binding protein
MRGRVRLIVALLAGVVTLAACGSKGETLQPPSSSSAPAKTLTVLAASSLSKVFPEIGDAFTASNPGVTFKFEFAGTDALTAQIEQGAPADVFAGASTKYGDQLSGEGLIASTRPFATNRLVLILPANDPAGIASLQDLTKPGIKLVIGAETVPVGAYTRKVLTNLDALYGTGYSDEVLANVVSNEDSVSTVVSKVQLGEADAGFVYVTDALAAGAAVKTIELPAEAQAVATYPIAAVKASKDAADAARFVDLVLSPAAQALLKQAGFGPPPTG